MRPEPGACRDAGPPGLPAEMASGARVLSLAHPPNAPRTPPDGRRPPCVRSCPLPGPCVERWAADSTGLPSSARAAPSCSACPGRSGDAPSPLRPQPSRPATWRRGCGRVPMRAGTWPPDASHALAPSRRGPPGGARRRLLPHALAPSRRGVLVTGPVRRRHRRPNRAGDDALLTARSGGEVHPGSRWGSVIPLKLSRTAPARSTGIESGEHGPGRPHPQSSGTPPVPAGSARPPRASDGPLPPSGSLCHRAE